MSALTVRQAEAADRAVALALWQALHREHETLDSRYRLAPDAELRWANDFDLWLRGGPHRVLLATSESVSVGLLVAHLGYPISVYAPAPYLHIDDLYVVPAFRGKGGGRALVAEAERWGRAEGATSLQVGALSANVGGRRFWEREGLTPYNVTLSKPLT